MNYTIVSYVLNIILFCLLLFVIFWCFFRPIPQICQKYSNIDLELNSPCLNVKTNSPILISGKINSNFVFEANFRIHLLDKSGKIVETIPVQTTGDWMVPGLIPFDVVLPHSLTNQIGALVFENDNPSGLPENVRQIHVPILIQ